MKKNAKRAVPSKALLASADSVLQWLREKARSEDRRSDAQHYADTQWMMRHDMKANDKAHFSEVSAANEDKVKRLVLPYFCPLSPDTDADKLANSIAIYLGEEGVEDRAALPVAIAILASVQEFALHGADAAHECLQQHLPRSKRQNDRLQRPGAAGGNDGN